MKKTIASLILILAFASNARADIYVTFDDSQNAQYRKNAALIQSVVTARIYEIPYYHFAKVSSYAYMCIETVGDEAELAQHLKDQIGDDKSASVEIRSCVKN